ncbi:MAG: cobalamin-binding protein [Acidobacteriia bacterium]|nr:cobalamin-binding protein [Terriglobia bacterium]
MPAQFLFLSALLLQGAPQRIVSTAPNITETLFALGAGDRVVGVSQYCNYPEEAKRKARIGTYLNPDAETILSLRPDLVIVQKLPGGLADKLRRLNLRVVEVGHGDLAATLASFRQIGEAAGVPAQADALVASIRARLARIGKATRSRPRRSVTFIVGRIPDQLSGIVVVGSGAYLNELFESAGGANVFAGAALQYFKISLEQILGSNPDVIIDMGDMAETVGVSEQHKKKVVALWGKYPTLKAVRAKRVYAVASDIFVVPGPRIADAAEAFARMLHPELSW